MREKKLEGVAEEGENNGVVSLGEGEDLHNGGNITEPQMCFNTDHSGRTWQNYIFRTLRFEEF